MEYESITPFLSKRNKVFLAQGTNGRPVVVKDFSQSRESLCMERRVSRVLYAQGIAVPELLEADDSRLVYRFIEGTLAVDLLGQLEQPCYTAAVTDTFGGLCDWLVDCYAALESVFGCEMVLGDAHLRNFICGDRVYGVDFECVAPGRRESDIAALALFTLSYDPACTPAKYTLAAFLCRRCIARMGLDADLLRRELDAQLEMIAARRKIPPPPGMATRLWERVIGQ